MPKSYSSIFSTLNTKKEIDDIFLSGQIPTNICNIKAERINEIYKKTALR